MVPRNNFGRMNLYMSGTGIILQPDIVSTKADHTQWNLIQNYLVNIL
nr:MAG TPA: hypothetical protein [Caudoviricetes sp.]